MGSDGSTPLILASMTGSDDVVLFLTGIEGVDVDLANKSGQTALYIAVAKRHAGVVKAILSRRRVDVNRRSRERDRHTPLTLASYTGQCNIVQLLLEMEGIDINGRNILGQTALELAVQEGHQDIVELWLQ
ncbi:ankyrin, partial [Coprinopsis marcescibilis]